jgi:D-alanine-D-alanine ligase
VSRVSGRAVADALAASFARVVILELNSGIAEQLSEHSVDVVFPVLHGPPGEDGTFQGFLETVCVPYVGSGVRASACAMDKTLAKHLFRECGLPVARDVIITRDDDIRGKARQIMDQFGEVVVKPSKQGSALGVSFPISISEIEEALIKALTYDDRVLIEERITGREITVGILERNDIEVLPVVEVRTPSGTWYDYKHRYTAGLSEHIVPAVLPDTVYKHVQNLAKRAHIALSCRDLSRVDFIVSPNGEAVVLEVNNLPGMTPTSLYPDAARAAGISFEVLVSLLVQRALQRGTNKPLDQARHNVSDKP